MEEFIISTDLAKIQSQSIEANFTEMKTALTEMMEPYKNLVMTDVASAKSARAYCNKVKKSIDDARKTVKKMWNDPYTRFEERCKELTGICDEAAYAIDAQIKAVEEEEKALRINTLRNYFNSCAHDVEGFVTFENIYNPKWETKSYGIPNAQKDIDEQIARAVGDLAVIRGLKSKYEETLLVEYANSLSLSSVMAYQQRLEAMERRNEEKREQEERAVQQIGTEEMEEPEETEATITEEPKEKLFTFTLEFTATKEQAFAINDFFKSNNIKFRKVK